LDPLGQEIIPTSIYEDLTLLFDIKGDLPRRSEDSPVEPLPPDKLLDIYKDISANIRVTDDMSFKLLGIVPLTMDPLATLR
jgi:hypothetical protein